MNAHFDLFDLRLFVLVAEERSLTRAAAKIFISLPAASMRVKNIEQSIGVALLNRSSSGVTLSPAGETFLFHARQILGQVELLSAELHEFTEGIKGHVRIMASTTAMTEFIPNVLGRFLHDRPYVNVDLRERSSQFIVRAVMNRTTDIGVVADNVNIEGVHAIPYRQDRLLVAVAHVHPLASRKLVSFEETVEYNFVSLDENSAIHAFLKAAAARQNKRIKLRVQVGGFESMCRLIASNAGIGILSESAAKRHAKNLPITLIRMKDDWAVRKLLICTRENEQHSNFTAELIDFLVEDGRQCSRTARAEAIDSLQQ